MESETQDFKWIAVDAHLVLHWGWSYIILSKNYDAILSSKLAKMFAQIYIFFYWNATFYYFQPRMAFIAILNHFGLFWMKKIPKIVGQNFRISGHSVLNLRKICSARLIFSISLCNVWLGLNLRGILVWKLSSFELEKHCQN